MTKGPKEDAASPVLIEAEASEIRDIETVPPVLSAINHVRRLMAAYEKEVDSMNPFAGTLHGLLANESVERPLQEALIYYS
jgi:hypothetical protein